MARDFYATLGLKRTASEKEIKQAYRRLARKHHPDVNPGDKGAEERFKEINQAYEVLSEPAKRSKYDRYGDRWEQAEAFEKARQQAGAQGGFGAGAQTFEFDLGDLFARGGGGGGRGFESIFDLFRGAGQQQRTGPSRGQNVEYSAEITLEEAYAGTARTLELQGEEPCSVCKGRGEIAGAVCHVCQGQGVALRQKRLEVKIPAGARDGTRVRLAREGAGGAGGGPRGDLYVVVKVLPHASFERRSDDLVTEVPVAVEDAVLGGEAEVQTIAGKRIAVKVPPLTQNGRSIRLSGLGMPKLDGNAHGDLIARMRIVLPEKLSERERELFEGLRTEKKKTKGKPKTKGMG